MSTPTEPADVRLDRAWAVERVTEAAQRITPELVAELPREVLERCAAALRVAARTLDQECTRRPGITPRDCTCVGHCRGPEGLGEGWRCALGKMAAKGAQHG